MPSTRRDLQTKLLATDRRIGNHLDAAREPAEMRRLITQRKGVRLMLESTRGQGLDTNLDDDAPIELGKPAFRTIDEWAEVGR